jgi:hypothetical protein
MVISLESLVLSNDVEEFVTSVLQSQHWICYRTLVCASTLILGVPRAICGLGGTNKNQRVNWEKRRSCWRAARTGAVDTFVLGVPRLSAMGER